MYLYPLILWIHMSNYLIVFHFCRNINGGSGLCLVLVDGRRVSVTRGRVSDEGRHRGLQTFGMRLKIVLPQQTSQKLELIYL